MQIVQAVAHRKQQLRFFREEHDAADGALGVLYDLAETCTAFDPAARPTAAQLEARLRSLLRHFAEAEGGLVRAPVGPLGRAGSGISCGSNLSEGSLPRNVPLIQ